MKERNIEIENVTFNSLTFHIYLNLKKKRKILQESTRQNLCICMLYWKVLDTEHFLSMNMLCKHLVMSSFLNYAADRIQYWYKNCKDNTTNPSISHKLIQVTKTLYFINIHAKLFVHKFYKMKKIQQNRLRN